MCRFIWQLPHDLEVRPVGNYCPATSFRIEQTQAKSEFEALADVEVVPGFDRSATAILSGGGAILCYAMSLLPAGSLPALAAPHDGVADMVSLQEQLLKAGLVDKNKVKQVNQDKSKQKKVERRTGVQSVDETRLAAQEAQRKNAERARELNIQRDAAANQKAILAQIAQMVQKNRQSKGNGDIAYNFTHGTSIERIYVSAAVQAHLVAGRLVIVAQGGGFELVPRVIADKIAERDPSLVVRVNKTSAAIDEDDPYAAFQIPDDLMW